MTDLAPSEHEGFGRYFLDDAGRPRLWPCVTLFLDVLGVTNRSNSDDELRRFQRAWRRTFGFYRNENTPWPVATFSDLIVLAAPMGTAPEIDPAEEDPVSDIVFNAGLLQVNLASEGYIARGAIVVGDLHLHDEIVFGPALVKAYRLERDAAIYPRVIVDADVEPFITGALGYYADAAGHAPQNSELMRDADGRLIVDYLGVGLDDPEDAEPILTLHRALVLEGLTSGADDSPTWEKYRWVADYHNAAHRRSALESDESLSIPAADTSRRFRTLVP